MAGLARAVAVDGPEGPPGPTGATGATGATGTNGATGATGATPIIQVNDVAMPTEPKLDFRGFTGTDDPANLRTIVGYPLINPIVTGLTCWEPLATAEAAVPAAVSGQVFSQLFTTTTTSGAHTAVQVGLNVPLPGQTAVTGMPAPPTNGGLRLDYKLSVESTTLSTPAGAEYSGQWSWSVHGATVTSKGSAPQQFEALGTASGGALPSGWSATIQVTGGQAQVVVTTDSSDTYNVRVILEWGYT